MRPINRLGRWENIVSSLEQRDLIEVIERHAKAHHVSVAEVCGTQRTKAIIAARHGAWAEIAATTTMSISEIGRLWGGTDHTTILHGVKKARATGLVAAAAKVRVG